MILQDYKNRILELAQKWMLHILTAEEYVEFASWYLSLEGTELGAPIEQTVDRVEKRLHQQFSSGTKPPLDDPDSPPYPL